MSTAANHQHPLARLRQPQRLLGRRLARLDDSIDRVSSITVAEPVPDEPIEDQNLQDAPK